MQDSITKEIIVKAKKEQVYEAITSPEKIIKWFPDAIEGILEEGQQPILIFDHDGTLYRSRIHVESAKPFEYFSYRWVPGGNGKESDDTLTVPTTLVEFFIEEFEDGSKITVKESGFSSLPIEIAEQSLNQNSGGWDYMTGRLEGVLNTE
jgi:uncharacterized protein YndB with AHSA1/START domain